MANPMKSFLRKLMLRAGVGTEPVTFLPLTGISKVAVYVDPEAQGASEAEGKVRAFFADAGKDLELFCPGKKDLTCTGRLKRRFRVKPGKLRRHEDLFISLATSPECFGAAFEAARSDARMKIGCCNCPPYAFNVVFSPAEGTDPGQAALFVEIAEFLKKIK